MTTPSPAVKWLAVAAIHATGLIHAMEARDAFGDATYKGLLFVGNWVERKGIHSLLEAFARLPAGAATLHLVGDENVEPRYATRLRTRLSRRDLAGRVRRHGILSPERVAAFYQAADAFVLPSLKEPYGTVYGEAMAMGLPVAGWRAGNLPYLAEDGREGLLAAPGDLAGLAAAMLKLAQDEGLRRRLGEAARRRALTRPTWEESAALFFGAIRSVAEAASQGGRPRLVAVFAL